MRQLHGFFYAIGHFVGPFLGLAALVSLGAYIFAAEELAASAWTWTLRLGVVFLVASVLSLLTALPELTRSQREDG